MSTKSGHHAKPEYAGYFGRAGILAARLRRFEDEHVREPGWFKGFARDASG